MRKIFFSGLFSVAHLVIIQSAAAQSTMASHSSSSCSERLGGQIWIEGSEFVMGDDTTYQEEGPAHPVTVSGFWIDAHEVTNSQFAEFVEETDYVTVAEQSPDPADWPEDVPAEFLQPGSVLFTPPATGQLAENWWSWVACTNWRHPEGPESNIVGKDNYPVVHIAFEDALAYAKWAERSLPTEAQFELAARNKRNSRYAWDGNELAPNGHHHANTWQGSFPMENNPEDGYPGLAPVGCFEPNDYGVYDLIGNVWEWTSNWYLPKHDPADSLNPIGPSQQESFGSSNGDSAARVIKGGSYLCAENYCLRYRPAARQAQESGLGTSHIGFRTVLSPD